MIPLLLQVCGSVRQCNGKRGLWVLLYNGSVRNLSLFVLGALPGSLEPGAPISSRKKEKKKKREMQYDAG